MGDKRLILIASLAAVCISIGIPEGFQRLPYVTRMLTYHLFHANIFHLAANSIAIWFLFGRATWKDILWAYAIACAVYPLSSLPVIGISNILFAMIGINTPSFKSGWWRSRETITFLAVTVLMLAVPKVAATTHIASFVMGTALSQYRIWTKKFNDTYEKANRK